MYQGQCCYSEATNSGIVFNNAAIFLYPFQCWAYSILVFFAYSDNMVIEGIVDLFSFEVNVVSVVTVHYAKTQAFNLVLC